MLYCKDKFLYVHIYKTGGTNLTSLLGNYSDNTIKNGKYHNHIVSKELKKIIPDYNSVYKFAFVRNTWDWLISHYYHILQSKTHPDHKLISGMSFDSFVSWLGDVGLNRSKELPHLVSDILKMGSSFEAPYYTFTDFLKKDGEVIVDYIGRTDKFQESMDVICTKLDIPKQKTMKKDSRVKDKGSNYTKYYNDATIQKVYDIFKEDIDWFNFKFGENIL